MIRRSIKAQIGELLGKGRKCPDKGITEDNNIRVGNGEEGHI
jgi:hypothetical protein